MGPSQAPLWMEGLQFRRASQVLGAAYWPGQPGPCLPVSALSTCASDFLL